MGSSQFSSLYPGEYRKGYKIKTRSINYGLMITFGHNAITPIVAELRPHGRNITANSVTYMSKFQIY